MLNQKQSEFIVRILKKEQANYVALLNHENAKPLKNQDTQLLDQLTDDYHELDTILDEVQRVGV
ncbi:hypothetical protein [Enterococcus sp. UD-01]|jgi:hypothetical protein|uniref:hypothetical protein n=1 Tax=Enterococcus sp. UD-01 TaxID=3373911 RepID=UPI0038366A3B